jgi:hypothetical protein
MYAEVWVHVYRLAHKKWDPLVSQRVPLFMHHPVCIVRCRCTHDGGTSALLKISHTGQGSGIKIAEILRTYFVNGP